MNHVAAMGRPWHGQRCGSYQIPTAPFPKPSPCETVTARLQDAKVQLRQLECRSASSSQSNIASIAELRPTCEDLCLAGELQRQLRVLRRRARMRRQLLHLLSLSASAMAQHRQQLGKLFWAKPHHGLPDFTRSHRQPMRLISSQTMACAWPAGPAICREALGPCGTKLNGVALFPKAPQGPNLLHAVTLWDQARADPAEIAFPSQRATGESQHWEENSSCANDRDVSRGEILGRKPLGQRLLLPPRCVCNKKRQWVEPSRQDVPFRHHGCTHVAGMGGGATAACSFSRTHASPSSQGSMAPRRLNPTGKGLAQFGTQPAPQRQLQPAGWQHSQPNSRAP